MYENLTIYNDVVMDFPKRKQHRLSNFDYSQSGLYFITICVQTRENILSEICKDTSEVKLTYIGDVIDNGIKNIRYIYNGVSVDNYVIMPDHVHLIIRIEANDNSDNPSINNVIKGLKTYVTKQIGNSIWQKVFTTM